MRLIFFRSARGRNESDRPSTFHKSQASNVARMEGIRCQFPPGPALQVGDDYREEHLILMLSQVFGFENIQVDFFFYAFHVMVVRDDGAVFTRGGGVVRGSRSQIPVTDGSRRHSALLGDWLLRMIRVPQQSCEPPLCRVACSQIGPMSKLCA